MRLFTLICLFLNLYSSWSFAQEDCPSVNVSTNNWSPLHQNQPGENWCYAVVSSDLITAATHRPTSAVALANLLERSQDSLSNKIKASFYRDNSFLYRFSFRGQSYETTFSFLNKVGVCSLGILDRVVDNAALRDTFLDEVFADLERLRGNNSAELYRRLKAFFDPLQKGFAEKVFAESQHTIRPLIDIAVDSSCDKKMNISSFKLETQDLEKISETTAIAKINALLRAGSAIGIGYDSKLIREPRYAHRQQTNHASILVGQYFDNTEKTCKYVIRATDKATCQVANPSLHCQDGYFTVPRDLALTAMGTFMWLRH